MEHTKGELELPIELALPVKVVLDKPYWTIKDQTNHVFMGRKQEKAVKSVAWFLNNCEEIVLCWNCHDDLLAVLEDLYKIIITDDLIPESVSYMQQAKKVIKKAKK